MVDLPSIRLLWPLVLLLACASMPLLAEEVSKEARQNSESTPVTLSATPPIQTPPSSGPSSEEDEFFASDSDATKNSVIELTDETFEHDTQAATGATTGDWFVEFYAPWCGHCKALQPVWEQLARALKGKVNVASVDATVHTKTASRFGINRFPTLKLFHKGQIYNYEKGRTLEELKAFALGGFKAESAAAVPEPMGAIQLVWKEFSQGITDIKLLFARKPEAAGIIFSAGLLVGVLLAMVIFIWCDSGRSRGYSQPNTPVPSVSGRHINNAPAHATKTD